MMNRDHGCDIGCDSQPPMISTNSMTRDHACESGCDSRPHFWALVNGPDWWASVLTAFTCLGLSSWAELVNRMCFYWLLTVTDYTWLPNVLNICALLGSTLIIRDNRDRTLLNTCDLIDFLWLTAEQTEVSSHPLQSMGFPGLGTGLRNVVPRLPWVGRQWFRNVIPRPDGRINVLD